MFSILMLGTVEKILNHAIDLDAITRQHLNQLQGQLLRVVIDSPQLSIDLFFDETKLRLEPTATGQTDRPSLFETRPFDQAQHITEATTTLHVKTLVELMQLLHAKEIGNLPIQGDYHLLQKLQHILQHAEPDLAAHLSPWIGANLAHEVGKVQHLPDIAKRVLQSKLFFAEDALKEDLGLLAPRWQMDELHKNTRQLQQNIDRISAKIQSLQQRISPDQD
ncbi:MAG: hypothetical protein QM666_01545 [Acinetobacter sp.]